MRFLADKCEFEPPQALAVSDHADLLVLRLEDRPLLDMVFEIGVHLARAHLFIAEPADALQLVAKRLAVRVLARIGVVQRMDAGKDAGRQHRRREARAFLIRPVGDDNGVLGLEAEVVQRADDLQPGEDAKDAVILAAGRLGVEVRADIDRQRVGIRPFAAGKHGAHLVDAGFEPRRIAPALEQMPPFAVRVGQGLAIVAASDARADLGHLHQGIPKTIGIDAQILAGCGHYHPLIVQSALRPAVPDASRNVWLLERRASIRTRGAPTL